MRIITAEANRLNTIAQYFSPYEPSIKAHKVCCFFFTDFSLNIVFENQKKKLLQSEKLTSVGRSDDCWLIS